MRLKRVIVIVEAATEKELLFFQMPIVSMKRCYVSMKAFNKIENARNHLFKIANRTFADKNDLENAQKQIENDFLMIGSLKVEIKAMSEESAVLIHIFRLIQKTYLLEQEYKEHMQLSK